MRNNNNNNNNKTGIVVAVISYEPHQNGAEDIAAAFVTSISDGDHWSVSDSGRFTRTDPNVDSKRKATALLGITNTLLIFIYVKSSSVNLTSSSVRIISRIQEKSGL
jgi:hypothetical protein